VPYADMDRDTAVGPCPMSKHLVPDELWMFINPLLPPEPPSPMVAGREFPIGRLSLA